MSELKECPFCGGIAQVRARWVECNRCGACVSNYTTRKKARAAWNRRADGWQPIETAPKDGQYVMLTKGENPPIVAFWLSSGWDDGDFRSFMQDSEFTHWQPLPPPPTTGDPE